MKLDETRAAAERGDATAQFNLGVMYEKGEGVPKDNREAVKWYRKAAEQGHADAQYYLSNMYNKGDGVPRDKVQAYFWANVAGVSNEEARELRDSIAGLGGLGGLLGGLRMTRQQISEAQALSTEYFEQRK